MVNNIISLGVILAVLLVYFGIGKRGIWQAARTPDPVQLWGGLNTNPVDLAKIGIASGH